MSDWEDEDEPVSEDLSDEGLEEGVMDALMGARTYINAGQMVMVAGFLMPLEPWLAEMQAAEERQKQERREEWEEEARQRADFKKALDDSYASYQYLQMGYEQKEELFQEWKKARELGNSLDLEQAVEKEGYE